MHTIPMSFGGQEFADADLGDARRTRRLVRLADACLASPDQSLPDKCHDPAAYQATLRLFRHPAVTHRAVLAPHQIRTLDRAEHHPHTVLLVHDTTELDFSGHRTLADQLGPIGNGGGRGLLCHNSLAVDSRTGHLLGLVAQQLHVRVAVGKNEPRAAKRDRATRESRLWANALDEIGPAPAGNRWVHVADRGADAFEFLSRLCRHRERFVVRVQHDRVLPGAGSLLAAARAAPGAAGWELALSATPTRKARKTRVWASHTRVTLPPPHNRRGDYPAVPIEVSVVRVWEPNPPAGVAGVEWVLLTSEEEGAAADLRRVAGWYQKRWVIEEYHKGLKTGVGVERLQLGGRDRLDPAVGLLSVVAVGLVNLRVLAAAAVEPTRPATDVLPRRWVEVLSVWRYRSVRELVVREAVEALARLGGWIPRKASPGWLVLWRGWIRLHTFLELDSATPIM